ALEKKRDNRWANAEDFDREIQSLQRHVHRPEDLDSTVAFLSSLPKIVPPERPPTGSAQSRLDRQFGPQQTPPPSPSGPPLTRLPTAIAPGMPRPEEEAPPGKDLAPTSKRVPTATTEEQISAIEGRGRRNALLIAAAAGVIAIAAILLLRSPRRTEPERAAEGIATAPVIASPVGAPRPTVG